VGLYSCFFCAIGLVEFNKLGTIEIIKIKNCRLNSHDVRFSFFDLFAAVIAVIAAAAIGAEPNYAKTSETSVLCHVTLKNYAEIH
jgi:hypothetical protein